jgi:hypothetical protein
MNDPIGPAPPRRCTECGLAADAPISSAPRPWGVRAAFWLALSAALLGFAIAIAAEGVRTMPVSSAPSIQLSFIDPPVFVRDLAAISRETSGSTSRIADPLRRFGHDWRWHWTYDNASVCVVPIDPAGRWSMSSNAGKPFAFLRREESGVLGDDVPPPSPDARSVFDARAWARWPAVSLTATMLNTEPRTTIVVAPLLANLCIALALTGGVACAVPRVRRRRVATRAALLLLAGMSVWTVGAGAPSTTLAFSNIYWGTSVAPSMVRLDRASLADPACTDASIAGRILDRHTFARETHRLAFAFIPTHNYRALTLRTVSLGDWVALMETASYEALDAPGVATPLPDRPPDFVVREGWAMLTLPARAGDTTTRSFAVHLPLLFLALFVSTAWAIFIAALARAAHARRTRRRQRRGHCISCNYPLPPIPPATPAPAPPCG